MTIPSAAMYAKLIAALRNMKKAFDRADNEAERLNIDLTALRTVIYFLNRDSEVAKNFLTQPLGNIENALRDKLKGAHSSLRDEHPATRPGRPAEAAREDVQAMLAF